MRADIRQAALLTLTMGVQLGSTGAARLQDYFGSTLFSTAARIACIAAVVALLLGNAAPLLSRERAVRGVVASSVLQLMCVGLAWAVEPSARFALGIACTLAEGGGLALLMYLVLQGAMRLERRTGGVVVAGGFLIVNVWDAFFVNASPETCTVQWIAGIVLVPLFLVLWLKNDRWRRSETAGAPVPDCPLPANRLVPLAACILLVLLTTGVFVNFTGIGGTGSNAFFDLSVNIYLILVRVTVVAYVVMRPGRPTLVGLTAFGVVGITVSVVTTVLAWDTEIRFFGAMAVESVLYVMQPLILVVGMEVGRTYQGKTGEILLAAIGVDFANHVTRLLTPFFSTGSLADLSGLTVAHVAVLSLGCICLCAVAGWLLDNTREHASNENASVDAETPSDQAGSLDDPVLLREIAFYRNFRTVADSARLADREREVLYEAMHGYSADHIGERLAVSSQTVKTYLGRAYQKLGVRTKQEALRLLDSTGERQPAETANADKPNLDNRR